MTDKPVAAEREPLPPGILPNITDTDPPPLNPATEIGDGYVRVNEEKLKAEKAETPKPKAPEPHEAKAPETPEAEPHEPMAHPDHPEHHRWLGRRGRQEPAERHS